MSEPTACSLEGLFFGAVTVGERGQVVIPSEARRRFHLNTGDKLLVFGHPSENGVVLCKIDAVQNFVEALRQSLLRVEEQRAGHAEGEAGE